MRGEAADYDPATKRTRTTIRARDPDVSGPQRFSVSGADGNLAFTTTAAGPYRFGFSPCAMWGGQGMVEICAR